MPDKESKNGEKIVEEVLRKYRDKPPRSQLAAPIPETLLKGKLCQRYSRFC